MKSKYYEISKIFELDKKYNIIISERQKGKKLIKGGETMSERKDMKYSSELKRYIYEKLTYLEGVKSAPHPDLKVISAQERILKDVVQICEKRGRY